MRATLDPTLSEDQRAWLVSCGVEASDKADVIILAFDGDPTTPLTALDQADNSTVFIALVANETHVDAAIQAGATDAIVSRPPPLELVARIAAHRRIARHWNRRLQAQEQQARHTLAELSGTQDLLDRLIDATPNPVMAVDDRGRVLVFNRASEQALGYDTEYARTHMHVTDIYADADDARRVLAELRATETGMVTQLAVRLRARWGEKIPVVLSAAEVRDASGGLIATVGVFEDMREQVALKNRLEATTEQLIAAEHRAGAIALAGEAAYEINQPLTALMGTLELLEMQPDLSDRAHARLDRAQGHLQRIRVAVRNLANAARGSAQDTGAAGAHSRMAEIIRD